MRSPALSRFGLTYRTSGNRSTSGTPSFLHSIRLQPGLPRRAFSVSSALSDASQSSESISRNPTSPSEKSRVHPILPDSGADPSRLPAGWEDQPDWNITAFSQLPHKHFGVNQHMLINEEFKESLRQILWKFRAPTRYAFAYGSGVFPQTSGSSSISLSPHPNPPEAILKWQKYGGKVIDFIFGVSYTEHWHSLNLAQHRDHYSFLGSFGSAAVSAVQDKWGAGVYFNPYITVNGTLIKYGVVNLDTIRKDLTDWDTLYLAGRLHKPVKILRDDPRVRLANQINLISAVRTALLLLPEKFTERQLYNQIAGISYTGDIRMSSYVKSEAPNKVSNIVSNQLPNFRQLYNPLITHLPNLEYAQALPGGHNISDWESDPSLDLGLEQDMDPMRRANMVRRLPSSFRSRLYHLYQAKFGVPRGEFEELIAQAQNEDGSGFRKREATPFDKRIANETDLPDMVRQAIRQTVSGPSKSQSFKGVFTAGPIRSWRYLSEKRKKGGAPASPSSGGEKQ